MSLCPSPKDLQHHVESRTGRRVRNLRVEMKPGHVILRGLTHSYYIKQLAQHGVWELLPDVRLENAITVDGAA
jgi:hypothetical protein